MSRNSSKKGSIPFLEFKPKIVKFSLDFIEAHILPSRLVIVHLKNNLRQSGKADWYNANFDEWGSFFEKASTRFDVKFLILGDDLVPDSIHKLPNVLISRTIGNSLTMDLALIQASYVFMTTASGLAAIAIFSAVPYLVYKHPDHHIEEMNNELGKANHYIFARPFQKLMRKLQDKNVIFSDFQELYLNIPKSTQDRNTMEISRGKII